MTIIARAMTSTIFGTAAFDGTEVVPPLRLRISAVAAHYTNPASGSPILAETHRHTECAHVRNAVAAVSSSLSTGML
jgi:hypothetical protein